MPIERTNTYEAMFLVSQAAAADFDAVVSHIRDLFDRASAEVIALQKWDERRLAYEIDGQKRGIYFLAYFRAPAGSIDGLRRDCTLSEKIMRVLVLRADHLTDEEMTSADARRALADESRLRSEDDEQVEAGVSA